MTEAKKQELINALFHVQQDPTRVANLLEEIIANAIKEATQTESVGGGV